jgi:hypothetical protein
MRAVFALLLSATGLAAAEPLRFEWKAGEAHKFKVQHDTTISETLPGQAASVTKTKLTIAKTWSVASVDADGTATMSLTITAFRQEITRPVPGKDGKPVEETSVIDSSTPEGAQATSDYLNKAILTAKVDARGRVSEVKATVADAASRLQAELPFRIELPEAKSEKWERAFTIRLDPPAGTGEQVEALQSFAIEKTDGPRTTVKVGTSLKSPPKEIAEMQPLLPWLWEGTVTLEGQRYAGAKLSVSREYPNHQGVGSKFSFASTFEETREQKSAATP